MDSTPSPATLLAAQPSRLKRLARRLDKLFVWVVVVPTLAAVVYYGLIASDIYVSESRYVVRSSQRQSQAGLGALLQSTGFSRSQDDSFSVHDYILSRDALQELDQRLNLRQHFSSTGIDLASRFPGLEWDKSFESLYRYYLKHVSIASDPISSISVLQVRAYSAEQASAVNEQLLQLGERLVNRLNDRSRKDLIESATKEVAAAERRSAEAALALSSYRSQQSVFDPDRQSALQLQGVAKLQEELLATEAQLLQLRRLSPSNPQVETLTTRAEALRKTIAAESAKVAGGEKSFTSKSAAFDRLALEKTFADRQLAAALATLETNRNEAQRQLLYLERLAQPNVPDIAIEPRRLRTILMVFVLGLIVWGVLSLVVASVKEHAD